MLAYEREMLARTRHISGVAIDYDGTDAVARRELLLANGTLFIFGCEESYGCLANDTVRDKDANAACLMVCELAAYARSRDKTLPELRDDMYAKYGYFGESVLDIYHGGTDGTAKIGNILESYRRNPPRVVAGREVAEIIDFSKGDMVDADGKSIPPQQFFSVTLAGGVKFAVRASGTEPKIKFYLFAEEAVPNVGRLAAVKEKTAETLECVREFLRLDADERSNFSA
jgi:phosphoglucomutase